MVAENGSVSVHSGVDRLDRRVVEAGGSGQVDRHRVRRVQSYERVHNGGDIIGSPPGKEEVPCGQPVAALNVGDHRQGHRANLVWPSDEIPAGKGPLAVALSPKSRVGSMEKGSL